MSDLDILMAHCLDNRLLGPLRTMDRRAAVRQRPKRRHKPGSPWRSAPPFSGRLPYPLVGDIWNGWLSAL